MGPRNPITQVLCFAYKIHLFVHGRMYTHNYVEEREGVLYIYFHFTKCQNQRHFIKINVQQRNDRDKQN